MAQVTSWRWVRLLGGMAIYALTFWGGLGIVSVTATFLERLEIPHIDTAILVFLGMLLVAILVLVCRAGAWIGSLWWLLSPVVVVMLPTYYIPALGQEYFGWPSDPGWMFVLIAALIYAVVSLFAAALGVEAAYSRADASSGLTGSTASWAIPMTLVGAVLILLGLIGGVGLGIFVGLYFFIAGALASGGWAYLWR